MPANDYTISVSPSVSTAERTVTLDGTEFTIDRIGKVDSGDDVTVSVNGPSRAYTIQIRDPEEFVRRLESNQTGDATATFDTGQTNKSALQPRSYGAAAVEGGNLKAFHPLVVRGYDIEASVPERALSGATVTASISELSTVSDKGVPPVDHLETVAWTNSETIRKDMSAVEPNVYQGTINAAPDGYDLSVGVVTTEPSPEGDSELVGFSDPQQLSILSNDGGLTPDWRVSTPDQLQYSQPAVDADAVYVGGLGRSVIARDRIASGGQRWSFARSGSLSDSSPVLSNGTLYVGGGGGTLFAIDPTPSAADRVDWVTSVDSAITATPAVLDGVVYVGTNDGRVFASDAAVGSRLWTTVVGGPVYSALATSTDRVFVTTADGDVVALGTDGTEVWRYTTGGQLDAASPVYDSGTVYVAGEGLVAIDANSGTPQWTADTYVGGAGATPTVAGSTVYVGGSDGQVHAFDASAQGSQLWAFGLPGAAPARPAVVGSQLIVADVTGTVGVLDRGTGAWIRGCSLANPVRSPITVDDGDAFVGTRGGDVVVFEAI
jgi:outer membrane protein assembly factor BamB